MAKSKEITPNFRTPEADHCKEEVGKREQEGYVGNLHDHVRDRSGDDLAWESELVAKSHGIYLEFNRTRTDKQKDWMYMVRVSVPGGGPLTREQYRLFDDMATKYTTGPDGAQSLRLTTRQNIQFHWVKKAGLIDLVSSIAKSGFYTLNGCGDNARNVMGCPLSMHSDVFDANALAREIAAYFRLPSAPHVQIFEIDPDFIADPDHRFDYGPQLMNRKFKIGIGAWHQDAESGMWTPDNCVELRTNDVGVAPILEDGRVERFQVYIGGGQGEKNAKPTFCALGEPFGVFTRETLVRGLDAIAKTHQEWGDRQNRHWARLKYVVYKMGVPWFQEQARARGVEFDPSIPDYDYGDRHLHHGWHTQPDNGLLTFGAFIENGRLKDAENGRLKSMVRHLMETYPINAMTTPNQDLLFSDIPVDAKEDFEADMASFGYGERNGKPYSTLRRKAVACVGLYTCRLAYTESEQFLPELIDELEARGWGDLAESVGISGCERQCSRPATKAICWNGSGKNQYQLKLGGSENARHQGMHLIHNDRLFLKTVPRDRIADCTDALFRFYTEGAENGEDLGAFYRRIGVEATLDLLRNDPATASLLDKDYDPYFIPETVTV